MELDLARLFAVLDWHKVAYVLIGGIAAVYYGSPFPTEDVDIAPQTDRANLGAACGGARRTRRAGTYGVGA